VVLGGNGMAIANRADFRVGELSAHGLPEKSADENHAHRTLEIPADRAIPTVKLIVHPDAMRGWNLELQVTNFRFAPDRVNTKSSPTEGHAHLYIDGQKITRLYGNWYYLASLEPGRHELKVTLNANGHELLVHRGQPIEAIAIVEVPVAGR
jgi:hypothetical protein